MLRPKKNSCKEFDNEKKFLRLKNSPPPPPPITFLMVRPLWKSARARCASFLPHSGVTWKTLSNTNRFYFFVAFNKSINYSVNYQ